MSEVDVAHYEKEGWCLVPSLLDARTCATLLEATERLEVKSADFTFDTNVKGVFFEMQTASGRKKEPAVAPGALRKITSPSKGEHEFARLRNDERVLNVARACKVKNPKCIVDQINFKHPLVGTPFPFHQDAAFIHGEAKTQFERHGGINMVIALDEAGPENGGFTVLGRTHTNGLLALPKGYDTSQMNDGVFDDAHRALPNLKPGDAVLFHPLLAHGSGRNESSRRRRMITLWLVGKSEK
jgi:ectoine hydroxylase-related dioxygenase (phytanoyl-CoA dioxygenase family)